jgi:hypothetical protein
MVNNEEIFHAYDAVGTADYRYRGTGLYIRSGTPITLHVSCGKSCRSYTNAL